MTRTARLALLFALSSLAACGDDGRALVRVDVLTDFVPGVEFTQVTAGPVGSSDPATYPVRFGDDFLAGWRVANLEDLPTGRTSVRVRLIAPDGSLLAEKTRDLDLDPGVNAIRAYVFSRRCSDVVCDEGEACLNEECVPEECADDPESCGLGCQSAADCTAPTATCAQPLCDEGACFIGSEAGACAAEEFCHPDRGCTPEPDGSDMGTPGDMGLPDPGDLGPEDLGPPDMGLDPSCGQPCDFGGACELGVFDCAEGSPVCVSAGPAPVDTSCRAAAGECDLPEFCTGSSTECPTDEFTATGTTCAAGFCDGLGSCGSCEPGAACSTGNPCEIGSTVCVGGEPTCERSADVAAGVTCAADDIGSWGSCGGFGSTCDTTGTRSRSVTSHTCNGSGTCAPSTTSETGACSRSTNGNSCGDGVVPGPWGSCGYTTQCDESASRSRTVTTYTCSAGDCTSSSMNESESCSRDTDGQECAPDDPGAWGTCLQNRSLEDCSDEGTQTRTATVYDCVAGTCTPSSEDQSRSCTFDATGRTCSGPAWAFPCSKYRCAGTSCNNIGDTCLSDEMCCESGCQSSGGGMSLCFE